MQYLLLFILFLNFCLTGMVFLVGGEGDVLSLRKATHAFWSGGFGWCLWDLLLLPLLPAWTVVVAPEE